MKSSAKTSSKKNKKIDKTVLKSISLNTEDESNIK